MRRSPAEVLKTIATLKKRAKTGDSVAQRELARIAGIVAGAKRQAAQTNALAIAKRAADVVVGREIDAQPQLYAPDRLEIADVAAASAMNADSLDQKVAARSMEWQQLDAQAPFVRMNPVSALNGTLGNQATLTVGGPTATAADARQQVVLWQGDDAETTPITVTLAPVTGLNSPGYRNSASVGVPPVYPYAIVQFGTRGFLANFECDIAQGAQFTLTASTVSVEVALEQPAAPTANSVDAQLSAMLSFGSTNRQPTPITRTKRPGTIGAGANTTITVPHYAARVMLLATNATITWSMTFLNSIGDSLGIITGTGSMSSAVDIPNGAYVLQVNNTAGAGNLVSNLVFELGF